METLLATSAERRDDSIQSEMRCRSWNVAPWESFQCRRRMIDDQCVRLCFGNNEDDGDDQVTRAETRTI